MWKKICPYWDSFMPFVILISTLDFTYTMNQQKYNSQQISEIKNDIEMTNDVTRGSIRINYIRQSINTKNADPFITIELEAPDLPPVECVSGTIGNANGSIQQPFEMCDGWDGSAKDISIPYAELPVEREAVHIIILAHDTSSKSIIDVSQMNFNSSAFATNVAIVGSDADPMSSRASLRVHVGTNEEDVVTSGGTCMKGKTCYYPYGQRNITERHKEIDVQGNTENFRIPQYDDSIMPFIKLEGDVQVSVSEKGMVKVSTSMLEAGLTIEVVVFDENTPHNILTNDKKYKCVVSRTSDGTYECSQSFKVTKDLKRVWVLVVAISDRDNSVVESTKVNVVVNTGVKLWVLEVSILGGICAVGLIAAAVFFTWKKRSNRNQEIELTSQGDNVTMEINSNLPDESCFENEVEIENEIQDQNNYKNDENNQRADKENQVNEGEEDQQENKEENTYEEIDEKEDEKKTNYEKDEDNNVGNKEGQVKEEEEKEDHQESKEEHHYEETKENQQENLEEDHYEVIEEDAHEIKKDK